MAFILMFTLQCFFPIFDLGQPDSTGISMVNTDNQTREFTVTVRAANGGNAQTGRVTLNARAQRALMLRETGEDQGFICAERCRRAVEMTEFNFNGTPMRVTISLGVATLGKHFRRGDQVLTSTVAG